MTSSETRPTQDHDTSSKRHQRTQSLEAAADPPHPKRQFRPQMSLDEMSAVAHGIGDFEAAFVMDSVGEVPTTFKSAMKSNNAAKWKEACNSEVDTRTRHGHLFHCQQDGKRLDVDGCSESRKTKQEKSSGLRLVLSPKDSRKSMESTMKKRLLRWPSLLQFEHF